MNKGFNFLFVIFRDFIMVATFILAIILEHASGDRLLVMFSLFVCFFVWNHLREIFRNRFKSVLPFLFIIDILLLVLLDDSSKFAVNYYFNIYYFFILIAAGFMLERKSRLLISFAVIISAFVKYYRYIEVAISGDKPYYSLPFVFSYIFFTFMVFVTIAIFFNYSRVLSEEKGKLDTLNQELKNANLLLEEKNERIKELTIFEERNRIAREIHDSVGHNLTGLVMNLDFCEKLTEIDPQKVKTQVAASRDIAKECLTEIRKSVQALKPKDLELLPLVKSVEELIGSSRQKFSIEISLDIKGEILKTSPEFNIVIYRTVQESITNSIKHGKATFIEIRIIYHSDSFSIFIKDNGIGSDKLSMGNGLKGMVERIKEINGKISFFSKGGFMINIDIPIVKNLFGGI